jgi:hypothetical protein
MEVHRQHNQAECNRRRGEPTPQVGYEQVH